MYGKIFESMYDGSLAENRLARTVFIDMVVLSDEKGILDMTPESFARRTNTPVEDVRKAIEYLESPDEKSRTSTQEGRRIERLDEHRDWGWRIINKGKYRDIVSRESKKANDRLRIAKKRKLEKECSEMSQDVADVAHTDTNTYTDADTNTDADDDFVIYKEVVDAWNKMAGKTSLLEIKKITSKQERLMKQRLKEERFCKNIPQIMEKIGNNDFLAGRIENARWKATFDWLLKSDESGELNYVKVLEGRYEKWKKQKTRHNKSLQEVDHEAGPSLPGEIKTLLSEAMLEQKG